MSVPSRVEESMDRNPYAYGHCQICGADCEGLEHWHPYEAQCADGEMRWHELRVCLDCLINERDMESRVAAEVGP